MRRVLAVVFVLATGVVAAAPSAAADPVGNPPQLIGGSGQVGGGDCTIPTCDFLWSFNVGTAINPGGGHFTVDVPQLYSATLTTMCIAFQGNRVILVGGIGRDLDPAFFDYYGGIELEDNGPGQPDRVAFFGVSPPTDCWMDFDYIPFYYPYALPLLRGNVTLKTGGHGSAQRQGPAPKVVPLAP